MYVNLELELYTLIVAEVVNLEAHIAVHTGFSAVIYVGSLGTDE
jgi:hypothetical protein